MVRDKDIIRTPYTSEINFKNTSPICNLEEIDCSTSGVLEDIEDTIFKLNDIDYDSKVWPNNSISKYYGIKGIKAKQ